MEDETTTEATEGTETPATTGAEDETNPTEGGEPENGGEEGIVDHEEIGGEWEEVGGEQMEGEHVEGEEKVKRVRKKKKKQEDLGEGEELKGEELKGEEMEGEGVEGEEKEQIEEPKPPEEEKVEEEEQYVEEPPPDPTAPFDFSDSTEALKDPFTLRQDQLAEIEQLWAVYQNYTPAYTDLDNYITEKELIYMLKALILMTVTPEQFQELIAYCIRPPHPEGHITFEQFLKMVTIRQRDFPIEDELRAALQVFDPDRTGAVDRDELKETLLKQGHKMPQKMLDNLIKEVDMANDGTIGIEDVVGTMCIDLNPEDLLMLKASLFPDENPPPPPEDEDL